MTNEGGSNANPLDIRHSTFVIAYALAQQSLTDYLRTVLALPAGLPALVLTLQTFGEYLDFHPHLHALVADGLFARDLSACGRAQAGGTFHVLPPALLKPLEELFRAKVLKLFVDLKLLPLERVQVLLSWKHSGFNVHHGDPVPTEHKAELDQLAQYILRNPFFVEKMTMESPAGTIIYRSRLNPKINRKFDFMSPENNPGLKITCKPPSGSSFAVGTTTVICKATDVQGNPVSSCVFPVTVYDNEQPVISRLAARPNTLWPADSKLEPVNIKVGASDNCGVAACKIINVSSSEPESKNADWEITGPLSVNLRAQHQPGRPGRVYAITVECVDIHGNSSIQDVLVPVSK